jgi:hypothetical protein
MFFRLMTLFRDISSIFKDAQELRNTLTRKYGLQAE